MRQKKRVRRLVSIYFASTWHTIKKLSKALYYLFIDAQFRFFRKEYFYHILCIIFQEIFFYDLFY